MLSKTDKAKSKKVFSSVIHCGIDIVLLKSASGGSWFVSEYTPDFFLEDRGGQFLDLRSFFPVYECWEIRGNGGKQYGIKHQAEKRLPGDPNNNL